MMGAFLGQHVVVTGANRGIGKAIAEAFANAGAGVGICARTPDEPTARMIADWPNPDAHAVFPLDLARPESIDEAARAISGWSKQIDVLVNNAGVALGGPLAMTKLDDLRHVFEVNVFGALALTQKITRMMMRKRKGAVITIGSTAGILADAGNTGYGASKAAIMHATRVLASELAPFGVRANAIAPSITHTDMLEQMDDTSRSRLLEYAAIKAPASPADIAALAVFLASDGAKHITGQIIRVDGGLIG